MIDSHEVLMTRIEKEAKKSGWWQNGGLPIADPYLSRVSRKIHMRMNDGAQHITVGYGGRRGSWMGGINRSADMIHWVTDRTVSPPLTRLIVSTVAGPFVGELLDTPQAEAVFCSAISKQGREIIEAMKGLLKQFEPKDIAYSTRPIVEQPAQMVQQTVQNS